MQQLSETMIRTMHVLRRITVEVHEPTEAATKANMQTI